MLGASGADELGGEQSGATVYLVTSATPWWGTLVVAALALFGVLWSQYRADVRERERITEERNDRNRDQRLGLYCGIVVSFEEVTRATRTAASIDTAKYDELLRQHGNALSTAKLVAPHDVQEQVAKLVVAWQLALSVHRQHGASSPEFAGALGTADRQMSELLVVMRADMGLEH